MKVIGIDIGTTSICGVVLDSSDGCVEISRTVNSEAFISTPNEWEKIQNVEKIVSIATEILDSFIDKYKGEIGAIGLTGQMHGIVYFDANGSAVSPLYTWQDARGDQMYGQSTYAKHLGSFSGYGNVTDFYNRKNGLVPGAAVGYCTVHDYFGMMLCKNTAPVLHVSDAASLGLYDIEKKKFDYDYNPKISDGFDLIGKYKDIPVSVAIGDNQASVFSTLASEDDLLINIGTGSQISIVSESVIVADGVECRPYVDGKYLIVGAALCGGRAFSLLKDFYKKLLEAAGNSDADVYGIMEKMIDEKPDTTLTVDTRFAGTRADATVRGSVSNIGTDNFTPSDMTLGVLRGMIDELYAMYQLMGEKRAGIVGSGNGVRKNKALVGIAEQVFGGKLRVPLYTEEAACGAALFALVALGDGQKVSDVQKLIKYEKN